MTEIILKGRLSWNDLFTAVDYENDGKFKYRAQLIVPKDSPEAKKLQAAIKAAATEGYGAKSEQVLKSVQGNPQKFFLTDGDEQENDEFHGCWIVRATRGQNKGKPGVFDRDPSISLDESDGRFYRGCHVNMKIDVYGFPKMKGIYANLIAVQFVKDGEPFRGSSAPPTADGFDDLSEGADDDDLS